MSPRLRQVPVITLLVVFALSSACASKQQGPEPVPSFTTSITSDGIKFFTYSLNRPERIERVQASGGRNQHVKKSPSKKERKRDKNMLRERVDNLLAENGYCRDGYFVLDHYIGAGEATLRGECKEGATPKDRTEFPSTTAQT